jgi:hypothetical protein
VFIRLKKRIVIKKRGVGKIRIGGGKSIIKKKDKGEGVD